MLPYGYQSQKEVVKRHLFLSWLVCLLSQKTVIILLQPFKHYPIESDWAMWILAIEQIAPQHLLTDWQMASSNMTIV